MIADGPFIGRGPELARLRARWRDAAAGTGQLALVSGPPGIGKSRIANEAGGWTDRPLMIGRALNDPGTPALWPWRRALRELPDIEVPAWGSVARTEDVAAARFQLAVRVVQALRSVVQPGDLLVLEDLHWADEATVVLLRQFAEQLDELPLLVIATFRPPGVGSALAKELPALLGGPYAESIALPTWSPAQTGDYLVSRLGHAVSDDRVNRAHTYCGGNPLYLRLLADSDGASIGDVAQPAKPSTGLRTLVSALLRGVPDDCRRLLNMAAVLGEDLDIDVLAAMSGVPRTTVSVRLEPAIKAGLLFDRGGPLRFLHASVRDGVLGELDRAETARLHRSAAAAFTDDQPARKASHLLLAEPTPAELRVAADLSRLAAANASRLLAFTEAATLLDSAATGYRKIHATDTELATLLIELATAQIHAGQIAASVQTCVLANAAAQRAGSAGLMAEAALVVQDIGDEDSARPIADLCRQALGHSANLPNATRSRLMSQLACALDSLDDAESLDRLSAEAVVLASAADDPVAEFDAIRARLRSAAFQTDPAEPLRLANRAQEIAPALPFPLSEFWATKWRMDALTGLGDIDRARQEIGQIGLLADRLGSPLVRWHLARARAGIAMLTGQFDRFDELNHGANDIAHSLGDFSAYGQGQSGSVLVAWLRGDPSSIPPDWEEVIERAPLMQVTTALRVSALLILGRRPEAANWYEQLLPAIGVGALSPRMLGALTIAVESTTEFNDADTAAVLYRRLLPFATSEGAGSLTSLGPLPMSRCLGKVALLLGEYDVAADHLRRAVKTCGRMGALPFLGLSRLELARALHLLNRSDDARTEVSLAGEIFRRLDMPGRLEEADVLLRDIDRSRRASDPLTQREREIAGLVVQALSNREIAARLVLSERTVESHVRNILGKLDLTNRTLTAKFLHEPRS